MSERFGIEKPAASVISANSSNTMPILMPTTTAIPADIRPADKRADPTGKGAVGSGRQWSDASPDIGDPFSQEVLERLRMVINGGDRSTLE